MEIKCTNSELATKRFDELLIGDAFRLPFGHNPMIKTEKCQQVVPDGAPILRNVFNLGNGGFTRLSDLERKFIKEDQRALLSSVY